MLDNCLLRWITEASVDKGRNCYPCMKIISRFHILILNVQNSEGDTALTHQANIGPYSFNLMRKLERKKEEGKLGDNFQKAIYKNMQNYAVSLKTN